MNYETWQYALDQETMTKAVKNEKCICFKLDLMIVYPYTGIL